jgi:alpha/beta superfamily hydrolase
MVICDYIATYATPGRACVFAIQPLTSDPVDEEPLALPVSGGPVLEARVAVPAAAGAGLVLCHPHPLYGGDMDNPVVVRARDVAAEVGLATLRFNFRGVGASTGTHGGGEAERDDIAAALAALAERLPAGAPVGLLGYSFGAWVSARVASGSAGLRALALVAPPLRMLPMGDGLSVPDPCLLVAGTRDPYCAVEDLQRLGATLAGAEVAVIDGADHFFFGKLFPLGEAVRAWARRWAA